FFEDPIPHGYDLISLVRILHDHDDEPAQALLTNIRKSLAPGARLMIQEPRDEHDDEAMIPESVTEWFCRWSHHERVHIYLKNRNISWGTVDIGDMVGLVCESHGQDVKELLNPKFSTDYLAEADLRFCALILRLADILDFDNTRSPDAIYRYLGLSKINRPDSNEEWQKHYASDGFRFPATDKCQDNYELPFIAGPDDPSVEYDIRTFLDTIENEIQKTRKILQSCDPKWQDIALPGKIKRNNIRSKHYDYAEYRFTLEQDFVDG
ncbi:MAG: methyltransferase, partial [Chloroflexota bacterium]